MKALMSDDSEERVAASGMTIIMRLKSVDEFLHILDEAKESEKADLLRVYIELSGMPCYQEGLMLTPQTTLLSVGALCSVTVFATIVLMLYATAHW